MNLRQLAGKLSPRGWAGVAAAVFGSILFLYVLTHIASKPSYTTLQAGIDPAQTGKITSALATAGIPYQLQNGGTAVAVPTADTSQARVTLAGDDLGGSGPSQPDFSLFNSQPLGESDFDQQVTYMRALEGQLAETIEQVQGVSGAQVELVLPNDEDDLYSDSTQSSSAAVLLSGGENLDPGAVRGIAQMVASSSVQGLELDKVTITDDTGELLWPPNEANSGGGALSKEQAQNTYDQQQEAQVDAMLEQTLGPDKAMVVVNSDLNANQVSEDSLTYTGKGVALTKHSDVEKLQSGNGNASATGSAIPSYAQTGTTGSSNYSHKIADTTFGVDKTVTTSTIAPGAVNRQSVSLLVSSTVPKSELKALQAAVENAVGYQAKRGDSISVGQMKFATPAVKAAPTSSTGGIMSEAKYGVLGLGAMLFLFFMTRSIRKRERESLEPTWLRELQAPRSLLELEEEVAAEPTRIKQLKSPVNTARRQIEDLAERDPERVAAQVRSWMNDG